jgi:hypothetical protein
MSISPGMPASRQILQMPAAASSFRRPRAWGAAESRILLRRTYSAASPASHVNPGSSPTAPLGFRRA